MSNSPYLVIRGYLTYNKVPLSFWFNHFFRAEIQQFFACFLENLSNQKTHSEINWPLESGIDVVMHLEK